MFDSRGRISRRRFLQALGIGTAVYGTFTGRVVAGDLRGKLPNDVNLSFVDQNGVGPYMDAPYVEDLYVPLHKEITLPPMGEESAEYQNAKRVLRAELESAGVEWSDDYRLNWSYQHYGAPAENKQILHQVDYCGAVRKYLYDHIDGLEKLSFNWRALNDSMDLTDMKGTRALVGKHTYFVLRVSAVDKNGEVLEPYLVNAQPVNRAIHYIDASDGDLLHPDRRLIYVIPGATSLVSPFSEMIHMSTHNPAMRYAGKLEQDFEHHEAKSRARSSGETVTESAAVLIAMDYLYELGSKDRASQVVRHANSLSNQLPEFSHSIAYMQKYGVQNALDVYQDNPGDYMKAIARMG